MLRRFTGVYRGCKESEFHEPGFTMSNVELHESFHTFSKCGPGFFPFVGCGRLNYVGYGFVFPLGVESVDLPEDYFTFAGGFREDKVVVEFYAVDII
jgi:hypothetical protein